jgi:hypothetical protein
MTGSRLAPFLFSALLLLPAGAAAAQQTAQPEAQVAVKAVTVRAAVPVETIAVGDTVLFSAVAEDSSGATHGDLAYRWFVTPAGLGTIDSAGRFVAAGTGQGRVVAAYGRRSGELAIEVAALPTAALEIELPERSLPEGSYVPFTLLAKDRLGNVQPAVRVSWRSSHSDVAQVQGGRILTGRPGSAVLTAATEGVRWEVPVTVVAGGLRSLEIGGVPEEVKTGDVVRLQLEPGRAARYAAWWVNPAEGALVEQDGTFVAERPGSYVVKAESGGREALATVRVAPRDLKARFDVVAHVPIVKSHTADVWTFTGSDGRDYAYVGTWGANQLKVLDVTDPAQPVQTDSILVDARLINDHMLNEDNTFAVLTREGASGRANGIVLLDTTTPAHPVILSEYTETVTSGVHCVYIVGDYVFLTNDGTRDMHVISVKDRKSPKEVARWSSGSPNRYLHDIWIEDGIAYLSYWDDGLIMLDVGNGLKGGSPENPVEISRIAYPEGNTHNAIRLRNYVFTGDEIFPDSWNPEQPVEARGFVHVIDVSDIEHPREVAKYEVPEAGAHNFWIEDDVLYVGYYQGGLRAIDVSGELRGDLYRQGREIAFFRPTGATRETASVPNTPMTWGAVLHKGLVYAADFNSGLWILKLVKGEVARQYGMAR